MYVVEFYSEFLDDWIPVESLSSEKVIGVFQTLGEAVQAVFKAVKIHNSELSVEDDEHIWKYRIVNDRTATREVIWQVTPENAIKYDRITVCGWVFRIHSSELMDGTWEAEKVDNVYLRKNPSDASRWIAEWGVYSEDQAVGHGSTPEEALTEMCKDMREQLAELSKLINTVLPPEEA